MDIANVIAIRTHVSDKEFNYLRRRIANLVSTDFVASEGRWCKGGGSEKLIIVHTEKTLEEFLNWIDKNEIETHEVKQLKTIW